MLNVIYHKTFKETGRKECICDEEYRQRLDYIEWFNSPDLVDRRCRSKGSELERLERCALREKSEEKILDDLNVVNKEDELEKKKRGRPKVKKE